MCSFWLVRVRVRGSKKSSGRGQKESSRAAARSTLVAVDGILARVKVRVGFRVRVSVRVRVRDISGHLQVC